MSFSKKFLLNIVEIHENKKANHYSHVTGKVIGYAVKKLKKIIIQYQLSHIINLDLIFFIFKRV